jgi:hypothetical protein
VLLLLKVGHGGAPTKNSAPKTKETSGRAATPAGMSAKLLVSTLLATASVAAASKGYVCPGSPSWVHAYVKVEVLADASCKAVRSEILSRIAMQGKGWHDPHNNGNYSVLDASQDDVLELQRKTGRPGLFTDKLNFVLEPSDADCIIRGCSESQVASHALAVPRARPARPQCAYFVRPPLSAAGV